MLQGRDPVTGEGLSDENIRYQLVTFLIAGHETTSGLLSFATYFLLQEPAGAGRRRAPRSTPRSATRCRASSTSAKLRYIEQMLMETLRIWPTAPAFALRAARGHASSAASYAVTRRDTLMVLIPMLHRDTEGLGRRRRGVPPRALRARGDGEAAAERLEAVRQRPARLHRPAVRDAGGAAADGDDPAALRPDRGRPVLPARGRRDADAEAATASASASSAAAAASFKLRSAVPAGRRQAGRRRRRRRCAPGEQATPLLVLYGSNTGSSEAFAERIASDAARRRATRPRPRRSTSMSARCRPTARSLILTASYEGQPPDNARQFTAWLEALAPGALKGVRYAVFGCGNRQWARTYQAVPKRFDAALEAAGATPHPGARRDRCRRRFLRRLRRVVRRPLGRPRARARQGSAGRADRRAAARSRSSRPAARRSCAWATCSTARWSRTASWST